MSFSITILHVFPHKHPQETEDEILVSTLYTFVYPQKI